MNTIPSFFIGGFIMSNKLFDEHIFAQVARRAVAEGAVLLKNENDLLPLKKGSKLALLDEVSITITRVEQALVEWLIQNMSLV